jgi:large subunit ribosomal protein L9
MEVILLQDVEKVGLRGDVVDVARGYARNFLLPRKLAEPASPARVAELEKRASLRARQEASTFDQARELADRIEKTELRFDVKAGPTGSLFGSVTATDLADELWKVAKIRVDRRKIDLADRIKKVGRYEVPVELFTDVTATVTTLVFRRAASCPHPKKCQTLPKRPSRRQRCLTLRRTHLPGPPPRRSSRLSNDLSTGPVNGLGKFARKGRYERPFLPPLRPPRLGTCVPFCLLTYPFVRVHRRLSKPLTGRGG